MGIVDFAGRKVLVMGLGLHGGGVAMARFLCSRGARVKVTDLRDAQTLGPSIAQLAGLDVEFVLGEHRQSDFSDAELIIRNPAVPSQSRYLAKARAHGVPIEMEMGIFFGEAGPARIVGVTGTRGKTTTATFIAHALALAGRRARLAGNMRISAVAMLADLDPDDTVVLELSSWQLEGLLPARLAPARAVVTNLLPDHLDRYRDLDEYAAAKETIVSLQSAGDLAVLNAENPYTRAFGRRAPGRVSWFSGDDNVPGWPRARIAGRHNRANLAAAARVLFDLGLTEREITAAVADFPGVPYRQQQIARADGIAWVNDTTATTPDGTIAALSALRPPFVWIAGGSEKHLDFTALTDLASELGEKIVAVLLLPGAASARLAPLLSPLNLLRVDSMAAAVAAAAELARPGDTVLLSPACASFGLFLNEFDRGDQFNRAVRALLDGRANAASA